MSAVALSAEVRGGSNPNWRFSLDLGNYLSGCNLYSIESLGARIIPNGRGFYLLHVQISRVCGFYLLGVQVLKFNRESLFWVSIWLVAKLAWHPPPVGSSSATKLRTAMAPSIRKEIHRENYVYSSTEPSLSNHISTT